MYRLVGDRFAAVPTNAAWPGMRINWLANGPRVAGAFPLTPTLPMNR